MNRRWAMRGLVVAAGLMVGVGSSPAFATTAVPVIHVTPNVGLHDGDTVTITGRNWPANDHNLLAVECNSNVKKEGQPACAIANNVGVPSNAKGNIRKTSFTVHTGTIGDGTCDSTSIHPCRIVVVDFFNTAINAQAKITFAP